jgi:hypothetical protein
LKAKIVEQECSVSWLQQSKLNMWLRQRNHECQKYHTNSGIVKVSQHINIDTWFYNINVFATVWFKILPRQKKCYGLLISGVYGAVGISAGNTYSTPVVWTLFYFLPGITLCVSSCRCIYIFSCLPVNEPCRP